MSGGLHTPRLRRGDPLKQLNTRETDEPFFDVFFNPMMKNQTVQRQQLIVVQQQQQLVGQQNSIYQPQQEHFLNNDDNNFATKSENGLNSQNENGAGLLAMSTCDSASSSFSISAQQQQQLFDANTNNHNLLMVAGNQRKHPPHAQLTGEQYAATVAKSELLFEYYRLENVDKDPSELCPVSFLVDSQLSFYFLNI